MFQNLFFFASCIGTLVVVDQLRSDDGKSLATFAAEFDISELSMPDQDQIASSIGNFVDDLPEIGARVDETVIRPSMQKIATVLQLSDAPDTADASPLTPKTEATIDLAEIVNFDLNTADLDAAAKSTLDELVRVLSENPTARLGIYGHTDLVGDVGYNMELGRARAEKVAAYLADAGIDADRIDLVKSYGETKPLVATEAPMRDNRRVHVESM